MHVLDRDLLARQQGGAPAEARREGDLGVALLEQGLADQVVEGAVEVAAAVEQALGAAEHAPQLGRVGRANALDQRRHLGIRLDDVGEDRDQPVAVVGDLAVLDLEVEPGEELAVRARGDQQGLADLDRGRQGVVGVAGQDHVDPRDP